MEGVKKYAEKILSHIPEFDPDIEVVKLNVQKSHVHMIVLIPPKITFATAIKFIKTQLTKKLKTKFPFI